MRNFKKIIHENGNNTISMDDPKFRIKPLQQVASACTGAMTTTLFMTPLDVIKTRLQAQQKATLSNKCFLYCNGLMEHLCPCGPTPLERNKPPLKGTVDAFIKISRSEGVSSLWSGLGPTLISALPSTVIYFVAYEQIKFRLIDIHAKYLSSFQSEKTKKLPFFIPLLAGVSARTLAVTVVSPIELCRTKMQSQKMTYLEMSNAIRSMIASQGVFVLWKGLPPTIYRDVPFSGIYWTCYETIKTYFQVQEPTFGFSFAAGAISGSTAACITTPFDLIKTHQQIEFGEQVIFTKNPKNIPSKSTSQRLKEIYRLHGIRGAFAGLGPRLAKVAPACAIMISSFEYGKSFFYKYNIRKYHEQTEHASTKIVSNNA